MPPPPHRLTAPLDGRAVFNKAVSWEGLMAGLARVRQNAGSAGGDGVTIDAFAAHAGERIAALSAALRDGSYSPGPLRVAFVDKAGGGSRKLTIPSVRDRVAQSSVAQILTPLLDAEMEDASFGYRPGRGVADAVKRVEILRRQGFIWTVDADIDDFFDTIPIDALLARFSQSVSDSPLTDLLALWLEQAAERGRGIAQGSPLSPLLSNLYLDVLDETLSRDDLRIVRYADDFLLLAKDRPTADSGFARVEKLLVVHGLRLDPEKTRIAPMTTACVSSAMFSCAAGPSPIPSAATWTARRRRYAASRKTTAAPPRLNPLRQKMMRNSRKPATTGAYACCMS